MDDAEFARWSRAVLALLSSAPEPLSSEELAEGVGGDPQTLGDVLRQMAARGLIRPEPELPGPAGARWRPC